MATCSAGRSLIRTDGLEDAVLGGEKTPGRAAHIAAVGVRPRQPHEGEFRTWPSRRYPGRTYMGLRGAPASDLSSQASLHDDLRDPRLASWTWRRQDQMGMLTLVA